MKNILIPTDFSNTSKEAFLYAQSFVKEAVNFKVMNAYHPQLDPTYPYLMTSSEEAHKERQKKMEKFAVASDSAEDGGVLVKTNIFPVLKEGLSADLIVEESERDTDLIIMGRTGSNSVFEKVFGTVSTHVAQNASCPVLLVPSTTKFKGIKKILFATNSPLEVEASNIRQILSLMEAYQPEIHFVQVKNDIFNYYDVKKEEGSLIQFLEETAPGWNFNIATINSDYVVESLHTYAEEHSIDMIVLDTKNRNTIAQIFHRSMTKKMVLNSQIPLLVLHDD